MTLRRFQYESEERYCANLGKSGGIAALGDAIFGLTILPMR